MPDKSFANISYRRNEFLPNRPRELNKKMETNDTKLYTKDSLPYVCPFSQKL